MVGEPSPEVRESGNHSYTILGMPPGSCLYIYLPSWVHIHVTTHGFIR